MKLAFWSNVRGQCGTTLHASCIAAIQGMINKEKVIMMENHDHIVNIESCMRSERDNNMVREGSIRNYYSYGLESLMSQFINVDIAMEKSLIMKNSITFGNDLIYYLPHGYLRNMDLLDYQFGKNMGVLFNCLERYFDAVYVDLFASENSSTKAILQATDVVIVNLNQNSSVLRHFFENFSSLREKAVFLIGNYYSGKYNNIDELRRKYQIPKNRIFAIPYCTEVAESGSRGCITNFIQMNYLSPSVHNSEFIFALHEAYEGIMDFYTSSQSVSSRRALSFI